MSFDSARFRHVLGHYPTGVTIVTADTPGGPVGLTIGSFTSVSLDPPLVGFLPGKASDSWPAIEAAGSFAVNFLADDQGDLCWRFAKETTEHKFDDVPWRPAPVTGSPVIDGGLGWLDCRTEEIVDAGDHWFVLGRVVDLDVEEGTPLIFWRGKLGTVTLP